MVLLSIAILLFPLIVLANHDLTEQGEAEVGFRGEWHEPDLMDPPPPSGTLPPASLPSKPTVLPPTGGANHTPLMVSGALLLGVVVVVHIKYSSS